VTTPAAERRTSRACAIFSVTDSFIALRGVDGAGAARQARGSVVFQLIAVSSGPARQPLAPGWTLPVIRGPSGAFISYGIIADPLGRRSRPAGPPLTVDVMATGPAYRPTPVPGLRLVNLDPAQPSAPVTAIPVPLTPSYGYPFPATPGGYALVRGEVLTGPGGAGVGAAQVTGTAAAGNWSDTYLTDSTGQWVFAIPDVGAGRVTFTAHAPSGAADSATVTITASTTIAVPVLIPH
jgi:hypothetical protein